MRSGHRALRKYFEDAASEMQAKAEEQKKLLQQKLSLWEGSSGFDFAYRRFGAQIRRDRAGK
jgi:hypothetical protein